MACNKMYFNSTFTCIAKLRYSLSTTVCMPPVIATHTLCMHPIRMCRTSGEPFLHFMLYSSRFFYDSIVHINEHRFECFIQNGNRIIPAKTNTPENGNLIKNIKRHFISPLTPNHLSFSFGATLSSI